MKRGHFIGLDTHCQFAELAVVTHGGRTTKHARRAMTIPAIVEELQSIARPRYLVIEEGPLADWLWRNLRSQVDEMQVCDPRRNRLGLHGGAKDDPERCGEVGAVVPWRLHQSGASCGVVVPVGVQAACDVVPRSRASSGGRGASAREPVATAWRGGA